MDGVVDLGVDGASLVDGFTDDVHDSSEGFRADRNHNGVTGVLDSLASDETVSRVKSNGSDSGVSEMLSNFENKSV